MNPFQRLKARLEQDPPNWGAYNIRIVALGDSVTQGLGVNPRMLGNDTYHEVFRQRLVERYPNRTFSVINAGVGGDSTGGALKRLQADVLDHRPDLVTVCFGLNDSFAGKGGEDAFRGNLTQIVTRCQQSAAVILLTPNMMATHDSPIVDPKYKDQIQQFVERQTSGTLGRYAQIIREVATSTSTPLADGYAEWIRRHDAGEDMTMWLINGINHPDARGHRILADELWKAFDASLR